MQSPDELKATIVLATKGAALAYNPPPLEALLPMMVLLTIVAAAGMLAQ
jgi:hypothetical protein